MFNQLLSSWRRYHASRQAVEQRLAKLALQLTDLLADRWLRHPQLPRRRRETARIHHRDEILELPQLHRYFLWRA
jgi:hypothetical protein